MPDKENKAAGNVVDLRNRGRNYNNNEGDAIEIDLLQLFYELKKKWLFLLLAAVLGGGLGYIYSSIVLSPSYRSTSMVYVMSKETTLTSLTDLQFGSQLTADYSTLINSRTVMENVLRKLDLRQEMNYLTMRSKISIDNPTGTRILNISILDTDPMRAKRMADAVAECSSEYIAEIMELAPPKIIEYGEVPLSPSGPNKIGNALIGALVFVLIFSAGILISMITNDSIKTEEDIRRFFDVPVLAVIPDKNSASGKSSYGHGYGYGGYGYYGKKRSRGSVGNDENSEVGESVNSDEITKRVSRSRGKKGSKKV